MSSQASWLLGERFERDHRTDLAIALEDLNALVGSNTVELSD